MTNKTTKAKLQKNAHELRVTEDSFESLKDVAKNTAKSIKEDLFQGGIEDIRNQIFGLKPLEKKYSGEIMMGEELQIQAVLSGQREKEEKLRKQIFFERSLRDEEKKQIEAKTQELRIHLHAITEEVIMIAKTTPELSNELKIAAIQAPVNPGIYHVVFFEKMLEFIRSFRQKIEDAATWLSAINKRAQKKSFWGQYKKHGGSYLLSGEHFSQRSAG